MTEGLTIFTFTSLRGEAQSHPRLHDLTFSSLPITETRARGPWCPQEDKDLVPEFVHSEGLSCLIRVGAAADHNYQSYILRG